MVTLGNLDDSPMRGVDFRLQISPRIQSQNRNGSNSSVRDPWRTGLCKNIGKTGSLPCPQLAESVNILYMSSVLI